MSRNHSASYPSNTHGLDPERSRNNAPSGRETSPFQRRNWTKAAVSIMHGATPPLLVKDYGKCILPARWIGRLFIAIEERALKRLEGVPGIPQNVHRLSPYALAMEYIDARPLSELDHGPGLPPEFADRLAALFEEIEKRGVVHGDPHFSNILCDAEGAPYLVDFAFSYVRGTLPVIDAWIFRNLQAVREHRMLKLRRVFYGETGSDAPRSGGPAYRAASALKKAYKRFKKFRKKWKPKRR